MIPEEEQRLDRWIEGTIQECGRAMEDDGIVTLNAVHVLTIVRELKRLRSHVQHGGEHG